ncbi:MAG: HlyD family efflux transporter periplasmic adaptor subunit [Clostridiaceae bacterium]|nr:HlyD family efflux transporter periplasmic adaptor subunit [Clostridiaceae bacterium]
MSGKEQNKTHKPKHRIKTAAWITAGIILAAGTAALVLLHPWSAGSASSKEQKETVQQSSGATSVSASGTSALGALTQSLSWTPGSEELTVAEVCAAAGDTVAVGDPLLKISSESVAAARTELEKAVSDASIALSKAEIQYQDALVQAKADLAANQALGSTAKAEYDQALKDLAATTANAREAVDQAKEVLADNPSLIAEKKDKIAAAEAEKNAADQTLIQAQNDLQEKQKNLAQAQKTNADAKNDADKAQAVCDYALAYAAKNGGLASAGALFNGLVVEAQADAQAKSAALADLDKQYQAAKTAADQAQQAVKTCENAQSAINGSITGMNQELSQLEQALSQAQDNLDALQIRYQQALLDEKNKSLTIRQQYQEALLTAANAQTIYEIAVQDLEQTLAASRQTLADQKADLAAFESELGDGTLDARYAGVLDTVGYEADDILSASTAVAVYANSNVVTIQVTIDQTDIAGIKVGDEAGVLFSSVSRQLYTGKVAAVTTTSGAVSASDVNYAVTVLLEGDVSALSGGLTGEVSFVKQS